MTWWLWLYGLGVAVVYAVAVFLALRSRRGTWRIDPDDIVRLGIDAVPVAFLWPVFAPAFLVALVEKRTAK